MKRILILFCIGFMMIFNAPMPSFAAGTLVDCEKSPAFTKRLNTSVKKLEGRLAKYKEGTPPYLALQEQINQTKTRFDRYGKSGLVCGTDGLPHLLLMVISRMLLNLLFPVFYSYIQLVGLVGLVASTYKQFLSLKMLLKKRLLLTCH